LRVHRPLAATLKPEYSDALRRIEVVDVLVKDPGESVGTSASNVGAESASRPSAGAGDALENGAALQDSEGAKMAELETASTWVRAVLPIHSQAEASTRRVTFVGSRVRTWPKGGS
jgi:hypothetical protein